MKELCSFYKILTLLWVSDEHIGNFYQCLDQFIPKMNHLFADLAQLKASGKQDVLKFFCILKGVLRGLVCSNSFKIFFDWIYPQYFSGILDATLNTFHDDDQVVVCVFKFLTELVFNRAGRLKFDTFNIDGLVVLKESAKYVI